MITVADKICYPFSVDTGTVSFPSYSFLINNPLLFSGAFVLFIIGETALFKFRFSVNINGFIFLKLLCRKTASSD